MATTHEQLAAARLLFSIVKKEMGDVWAAMCASPGDPGLRAAYAARARRGYRYLKLIQRMEARLEAESKPLH